MPQQLICDECGDPIDSDQPYCIANFQITFSTNFLLYFHLAHMPEIAKARLDGEPPAIAARYVQQVVGDGETSNFRIPHTFNSDAVNVIIRQAEEPHEVVDATICIVDKNSVEVEFITPPEPDQYIVAVRS